MFNFFKKKEKEYYDVVGAPIKGEAVPSAEVNDPTFAEEMLGKGMAIKPAEGKVYAPFDGEVALVFDTKHAVSLVSDKGAEVLIHVGLDTVMLKGEHYTAHVENDAVVKKGDLWNVKLQEIQKSASGRLSTAPVAKQRNRKGTDLVFCRLKRW